MAESQTADDDVQTATVGERDFQATATLRVEAESERVAHRAAEKYFKETHGTDPGEIMLNEGRETVDGQQTFRAVVVDGSSGSLTESAEYEF